MSVSNNNNQALDDVEFEDASDLISRANKSDLISKYKKYQFGREIPYFNANSASVGYLHSLYLCNDCLQNGNEFKQLIAHLSMSVIDHPYNIPLILNLTISYPMYRSLMFEKFTKLDSILQVLCQTPQVVTQKQKQSMSEQLFFDKFKDCSYLDVIAHYTQYTIKLDKHNINPKNVFESESDDDSDIDLTKNEKNGNNTKSMKKDGKLKKMNDISVKTGQNGMQMKRECKDDNDEDADGSDQVALNTNVKIEVFEMKPDMRVQYIRNESVLGKNKNYYEFLESVRNHIGQDHSQFLTISAAYVSSVDMDLLCSRFVVICEALVSCDFGAELCVDKSSGYLNDILEYLSKFVQFCIAVNDKHNEEFKGLSNDQCKLLMAGVVLLDLGLKKQRPLVRSVPKLTKYNFQYLSAKLVQLKENDEQSPAFELRRKIVDMTPGGENKEFNDMIDKWAQKMYKDLRSFFVKRDYLIR